MAWGTVNVDEQRVRFVVSAKRGEKTMRALCEEFAISRPTGYEWLRRYHGGRDCRRGGEESATAEQSEADGSEDRGSGRGVAAAAAGLGSAKVAGVAGARRDCICR